MIKKWILLPGLMFLLIVLVQIASGYEWNIGIKKFTTGMTIDEVEKVLIRYDQGFKRPHNYYSINNYFIKGNAFNVGNQFYNDSSVKISQINKPGLNFADGKVTLKKVFGYKLGALSWMNGANLFSSDYLEEQRKQGQIQYRVKLVIDQPITTNVVAIINEIMNEKAPSEVELKTMRELILLQNVTYQRGKAAKEKLKSQDAKVILEPLHFNPKMVYLYRHFPVKRINSLVDSVELSFIDDRLFKIMYEIELTRSELEEFEKHMSNTYIKDGYQYQSTEDGVTKYENKTHYIYVRAKSPVNENRFIREVLYLNKRYYDKYQRYLITATTKVNQLIYQSRFREVTQF